MLQMEKALNLQQSVKQKKNKKTIKIVIVIKLLGVIVQQSIHLERGGEGEKREEREPFNSL